MRFQSQDQQAVCPPRPAGRIFLARRLILRPARVAVPSGLQARAAGLALGPNGAAAFLPEPSGAFTVLESPGASTAFVELSGASAVLVERSGTAGHTRRPFRAVGLPTGPDRPSRRARITSGVRGHGPAGITILTGPSSRPSGPSGAFSGPS